MGLAMELLILIAVSIMSAPSNQGDWSHLDLRLLQWTHEPSWQAVGFLFLTFPDVFDGLRIPYLLIAIFQWAIYFLLVYLVTGRFYPTVYIPGATRSSPR